jgi:hypothetical protein
VKTGIAALVIAAAAASCARSPVPSYSAMTDAATTGVSLDANGADVPSLALPPNDDAGLLGAKCATATTFVARKPIYMLILLDGSGSMLDDNKWAAIVPALEQFFDLIQQSEDGSYAIGLTVFSDTLDKTMGMGPYTSIDVPIAYVDLNQDTALRARLDGAMPMGQTPTLAVLTGEYPLIESFVPSDDLLPNGKKVVVLMTDGVPYPNTSTQQPACIQAAADEFMKAAPAGPVTTVAVGIGYYFPYDPSAYDPTFMGALAVAGGAPNEPCDPTNYYEPSEFCHVQVTPTTSDASELEEEFLIAFDKVRSSVASCEFTLDKVDGGMLDPAEVNVAFVDDEGEEQDFVQDPVNGWTYDDAQSPTEVIVHGDACTEVKANVSGRLSIVLGCATIVK